MRHSALALGASVIALALTAGPAAADPGVGQTVEGSTGAAQIGAVAVDAPVRVASDGGNATTGASVGGPQTTGDSTGSAQVTSVDASAPIRVLSDGDDTQGAGSAGGTQTTGDSDGSAQVGAVDADAPVRLASDGDNTSDAGSGSTAPEQSVGDSSGSAQAGSPSVSAPVRAFSDGDNTTTGDAGSLTAGPQTVDGSTGSAQVGAPALFAPVRVLSGGTAPADDSGSPDVGDAAGDLLGELVGSPLDGGGADAVATLATVLAPAPQGGGSPSPEEMRTLLDGADPGPAIRFASGGIGDSSSAAEVHTLGVSASSLPLTGFGFMASALMGLGLFSTGLGLRLVPGGKRR
jgi:hypothetical protein